MHVAKACALKSGAGILDTVEYADMVIRESILLQRDNSVISAF